uniref:Band 7 domain-containing protein n=1 Tax=Nelumbo nucifera TaxID=4432 RepID=A0A822YSE8_NELNU|nr:TPA_asm: hypothetical protein HUJ06_005673 [Nelumbo nucifera]
MISFEKIEVDHENLHLFLPFKLDTILVLKLTGCFLQVVNRLQKDYVYETLLNYGIQYDNTWIYDKIHHEINQFCSSHTLQQVYIDMFDQIGEKMKDALQGDCTQYAPGIEIISVRATKPTIPRSIKRNFELMEEERTKVLVWFSQHAVVVFLIFALSSKKEKNLSNPSTPTTQGILLKTYC